MNPKQRKELESIREEQYALEDRHTEYLQLIKAADNPQSAEWMYRELRHIENLIQITKDIYNRKEREYTH